MPIDFAGISNENEFYSNHYLTAVFEGDIKETLAAWSEAETEAAPAAPSLLARTGRHWRRAALDYRTERDPRKRLLLFRDFADRFLSALGYAREQSLHPDHQDRLVPLLARIAGKDRELVWVVECLSPDGDDFVTDPLTLPFLREQFAGTDDPDAIPDTDTSIEDILNTGIFALDRPPRFVILLSMSQAVLIERGKWTDSRLLRFKFEDIFGLGQKTTVETVAALLHRTSLAPDTGTALLDKVDESSHRHAHGVSKDLKFALREAIEILGDEAARLLIAGEKARFKGRDALDARKLSIECLRYMYRLLFLFYIEARPELGFAPMKAVAYRKGYSLEGLRELELKPLVSDEDRNGHFLSHSLETLFTLVFQGTPDRAADGSGNGHAEPFEAGFSFQPMKALLFGEDAFDYLKDLHFRNETLQRVIRLLSLSQPKGNGSGRRGRISYAQLGISQLGAVYESLLTFSAFFAADDLIEVRPKPKAGAKRAVEEDEPDEESDDLDAEAEVEDEQDDAPEPEYGGRKDKIDYLKPAWFVPRSRAHEFDREEIVFDGPEAKIYPKGTFIYRLAGRDRQNSASYYTPEPLARLLVKHALMDLLDGKSADDILKLKICEPAMGSAAFLVETVNQLTEKYLELKQNETGIRIPHEKYTNERQKVRAYITDRNVFGVDLNPIAVELGQVSLWLNCLHPGGFVPWFGDQLHAGNSLVGARRAAYPADTLVKKRNGPPLWHKGKPREIGWAGKREPDEVWQFLLPDPDMANYKEKYVKPLAPEAWARLQDWSKGPVENGGSRRTSSLGFSAGMEEHEAELVLRLSEVVDQLFDAVADELVTFREQVNDDLPIFPAGYGDAPEEAEPGRKSDYREKARKLDRFHGKGIANAVAYKRLKTAMDAWCALFFWPIDKVDLLPTRSQFLEGLTLILEGGLMPDGGIRIPDEEMLRPRQGEMFETQMMPAGGGRVVRCRRCGAGEAGVGADGVGAAGGGYRGAAGDGALVAGREGGG